MKPTPKIEALDTVGAGDSFTASIISILMQGKSLDFTHEKAVEISAYVSTQLGAMPELSANLKLPPSYDGDSLGPENGSLMKWNLTTSAGFFKTFET